MEKTSILKNEIFRKKLEYQFMMLVAILIMISFDVRLALFVSMLAIAAYPLSLFAKKIDLTFVESIFLVNAATLIGLSLNLDNNCIVGLFIAYPFLLLYYVYRNTVEDKRSFYDFLAWAKSRSLGNQWRKEESTKEDNKAEEK